MNLLIPIIQFAREVFFEDYDNEKCEDCEVVEKIDNFAELTVPFMNHKQFKIHFRLLPETFEDLLVKIHNICPPRSRGYPRTALEKEVMVTICYLGNIESFRSVANRFGITKSTCWEIVKRIGMLLLGVNADFRVISWPSRQRQEEISNNLRYNIFDGVIGCIDGSHIRITAPKENTNSYVNRKSYHSLLLQAVCDDRLLFTDVYTGEPGSLHDYTLYRKSELFRAIQTEQVRFFYDYHLIGDLAYKLDTHLLVGFKDNGHLTLRQNFFYLTLSKIRVRIENAFALLKGRFRKLKCMETVRLDLSALNIISCCILHNICILNGDFFEDILNLDEERREEFLNHPENREEIDINHIQNQAIIKRNNVVNSLPIIVGH